MKIIKKTAFLVVGLFLLYFILAAISVIKQDRLWRGQYFPMNDIADAVLLYVNDYGRCPNSIDILVKNKYLGSEDMGPGFKKYMWDGKPADYKFIPPPMVVTNIDTAPPMIVPVDNIYYYSPKKAFGSNTQKEPTKWTKSINKRLYLILDEKGVINRNK